LPGESGSNLGGQPAALTRADLSRRRGEQRSASAWARGKVDCGRGILLEELFPISIRAAIDSVRNRDDSNSTRRGESVRQPLRRSLIQTMKDHREGDMRCGHGLMDSRTALAYGGWDWDGEDHRSVSPEQLKLLAGLNIGSRFSRLEGCCVERVRAAVGTPFIRSGVPHRESERDAVPGRVVEVIGEDGG